MLGPGAAIARLPAALDLNTRLQLQVVLYNFQAISQRYSKIYSDIEIIEPDNGYTYPDETKSLSLIADCWAIIDHSYALFKILDRLPDPIRSEIGRHSIFQHKPAIAGMRNFMDHAAERLLQVATKTNCNPLLGSLTFYIGEQFEHENMLLFRKRKSVTILTGSQHHENWTSGELRFDNLMLAPRGDIVFSAVEQDLQLSQLVNEISDFAHVLDNIARLVIEAGAQKAADENGSALEDLLRPAPLTSILIASLN